MGTIILSALVAHTGWHWMLDRWDRFRQFKIHAPELDPAFLASAMRWTMWILIAGGLAGLLFRRLRAARPLVNSESRSD
jgi:TRAP-type C4-dicarboxylate transport system permease small subunit